MNWGELGEEGTTIYFHSHGLDLLGRGEHILIWTGTVNSHYMPLDVMPVSIICVWQDLH